ncbi:MAG: type II toxin-antitoxin system VapC family toxin [Gemmatimonadaceae bacterium]
MIVPDVNLLLYAVHQQSPQHIRAAAWLESLLNSDEPVGLPWAVSLGFIRLITNPRVFASALAVETALKIVDGWQARRVVLSVAPGEQHWRIMRALLTESGTAGNLTSDAHLAAICIERGATLHSADADFGRFRGLRWVNPLTTVR